MSELAKTPLWPCHARDGAKLIDFFGWSMPLQYRGIVAEHQAVRTDWGIFDVSHMGELDLSGPDALAVVQRISTNDASKLAIGRAHYTVLCREHGGIVDDCIVYRLGEQHFRIVVNAANRAKDRAHIEALAAGACAVEDVSDSLALIAVQGPRARAQLAALAERPLESARPFDVFELTVAGIPTLAACTGYTGEDGFELFVAAPSAPPLWDALAAAGAAKIGLGARDTLRLEARLCLYGQDLDETTTPLEAGLGWVVKFDKPVEFFGRAALVAQRERGIERTLVGFRVEARAVLRPGAELLDDEDRVVGRVTSGGPSPTTGGAIALGYAPLEFARPGARARFRQRDRIVEATAVDGPFYRRPR